MSTRKIDRARLLVPLLLALVIAACGGEAGAGGAEGPADLTLGISSPVNQAEVADNFTVEFDTNVPLGEPETGNHHVHLCVDSEDCATESEYTLVYGSTQEVTGLTPGEHSISASLRNADHSDAGPGDEITVVVGSATDGDTGTTDNVTDTTAPGFDY